MYEYGLWEFISFSEAYWVNWLGYRIEAVEKGGLACIISTRTIILDRECREVNCID